MSSRLENILSTYDDYELAVMYHYLYATYLPATRQKIDQFLFSRGLDARKLEQLRSERMVQALQPSSIQEEEQLRCGRCHSARVAVFSQKPGRSAIRLDEEDPLDDASYYSCQVCGYSESFEQEKESFLKATFRRLFA